VTKALALAMLFSCSSAKEPRPAESQPQRAARGPQWAPSIERAFELAHVAKKGVMLEFYASWCVPCDELARTLHVSLIASAIDASFVPVRIDGSEGGADLDNLRARYQVDTWPHLVFVSPSGGIAAHVNRLVDEDELATIVKRAATVP
jgi:thiol:disulfide interchange protein